MTVATPKFGMGAAVLRVEDRSFITGKGRYTDDIQPKGALHGYVLRSPVAKAKFTIGALDVFVPALLKPAPRRLLQLIGADRRTLQPQMAAVIAGGKGGMPAGYRPAGNQAIRIDMAEKLFRAAHEGRARTKFKRFRVDDALATSMGLTPDSFTRLMRAAGFRPLPGRP